MTKDTLAITSETKPLAKLDLPIFAEVCRSTHLHKPTTNATSQFIATWTVQALTGLEKLFPNGTYANQTGSFLEKIQAPKLGLELFH